MSGFSLERPAMPSSAAPLSGAAAVALIAALCIGCAGTTRFAAPPASERAVMPSATPRSEEKPKGEKLPDRREAPAAVEASLLPIPYVNNPRSAFHQTGIASYYAAAFHGRRTASGERYDKHALTAAHPSLPFGSRVRVTNLSNGRSVVVRVNDRGPRAKRRIIDLSFAAAKKIGVIAAGTARVKVELLEP